MRPLEEFDNAIRDVTDRRGEIYGHPDDDFGRAARLKAVVAECADPKIRHAMDNICQKLARLIESPDHIDSWTDIYGYVRCAVMILDRREASGDEP